MKTLHILLVSLVLIGFLGFGLTSVHALSSVKIEKAPYPIFSPLKQFESGISPSNIKCYDGFTLVLKAEDVSPACVTSQTAQKLVERGWTILTTDLKPWVKIDTPGLNDTYVVNQPISFSVDVKEFGNYPCVSLQIKIHDNKNPNVPVFQDNGSTMSCPALRTTDNYSFDFPGSDSHYVIILNKTGDYAMTISYGDNSVQKYFSIVLPSNPQNITILENNAGIVLLKNQTYYFETPNYTNDAYTHPVQVSFHDVIFTLFPSGFRGGLPAWGCGGSYYWIDAKFSDGIHELLHIFVGDKQCFLPQPSTHFSNHTNPQAGLTFYEGKMKLLVSTTNQTSVQLTSHEIPSILPGEHILSSCGGGAVQHHSSSNILNSTGFSVYHNVMNYSYITNDDYVIQPGHQGTITYVIDAGSSPTSHIPYPVQKELNITNYAIFYHRITDYEELLHNPSVTISGGNYESCFKRPDGSCAGMSGPITGQIDATVVDHPGVNVSFEPEAELLQYNDTSKGKASQIITMTISVDKGAPQGTYWVILSPEECLGGEIFLMTVGDKPYHS